MKKHGKPPTTPWKASKLRRVRRYLVDHFRRAGTEFLDAALGLAGVALVAGAGLGIWWLLGRIFG